jgi:pellino protein
MLTPAQASAVAIYLVTNGPVSSSGYLDHGCETAWEMACDVLIALGYATEAPRGARLLPSPVPPNVLPRRDDACCVILSVAEQLCRIRLRHSWSEPDDKTGPGTADPETAEVLNTLGLTSAGAWTNAATPVLWRMAPEEVRPPTEQEFSAQVDLAIADIPDDIRDQIKSIYEAHDVPVVRDHQLDWVFYLNWRWGDAWLRDDSHGSPMGIFHDSLAQRVRAAVMARAMEA